MRLRLLFLRLFFLLQLLLFMRSPPYTMSFLDLLFFHLLFHNKTFVFLDANRWLLFVIMKYSLDSLSLCPLNYYTLFEARFLYNRSYRGGFGLFYGARDETFSAFFLLFLVLHSFLLLLFLDHLYYLAFVFIAWWTHKILLLVLLVVTVLLLKHYHLLLLSFLLSLFLLGHLFTIFFVAMMTIFLLFLALHFKNFQIQHSYFFISLIFNR